VPGTAVRASAVKTARLNQDIKQNALLQSKEDRAERKLARQRQAKNVGKMASATKGMEGFDIQTEDEFKQLKSFLDTADTKQKEEALKTVETLGKYSMAILNSQDQNQKLQMWEDLKANIPESGKGDMPDQYDEKWLTAKVTEAKTFSDMINESVAKEKVKANQEKIKSKFLGDEKLAKIKAKLKQEEIKAKSKEAIKLEKEKAKSKGSTKDTRLKLKKLFDLRDEIKKANPNNPDLKVLTDAINLASKGKPSEIDKLIAMQIGADGKLVEPETKENNVKVSTSEDFYKKYPYLR